MTSGESASIYVYSVVRECDDKFIFGCQYHIQKSIELWFPICFMEPHWSERKRSLQEQIAIDSIKSIKSKLRANDQE